MYDKVPPCLHYSSTLSLDNNVQEVVEKLQTRSEVGLKKYGVTTERSDLTTLDWLNHLQEELMDAAIYVQVLKGRIDEIRQASS